jgi:hypothetical protein
LPAKAFQRAALPTAGSFANGILIIAIVAADKFQRKLLVGFDDFARQLLPKISQIDNL